MYGLSHTVISEISGVFRQFPNIDKVLIFGSRAKGSYSEGSDIDLAILGKNLTFDQIMEIQLRVDDLELLYKVDIVDYSKNVGTPIGDHIDRIGLTFYERQ